MTRRSLAVLVVLAAALAGLAVIGTLPERFIPKRPSDGELFNQWARGSTAVEVAAFEAFLVRQGVGNIVPLAEVLRSDARWRRCDLPPFAVPPRERWKEIVPTLRYVRDHVEPAVGQVRVVSAYRDPAANRCFGGASASRHMRFAALDVEPVQPMARSLLVTRLCQLHAQSGKRLGVGLGIYNGQRFHIDTSGYRRWGKDFRAASSPCLNNS